MTRRAKKWWLIGAAAWLAFGVAPGFVSILDPYFSLVLYSVAGGLGVLAALLIHPLPRRWGFGVLALAWCFGWFYWQNLVWQAAEAGVRALIRVGAIKSSSGPLGNFGHVLMLMLILSCLITSALLMLMTRSRRVLVLTLIPAIAFTASWVFGFALPWVDAIWHIVVIGALMLWAVPKRIHPPPRFPAHACQRCGYDLRGLENTGKCPECGHSEHKPQSTENL